MEKLKSSYTETRELKSTIFYDNYRNCTKLSIILSIKWICGEIKEVKFTVKSTTSSSKIFPFSIDFDCYCAAADLFKSKTDYYFNFFDCR